MAHTIKHQRDTIVVGPAAASPSWTFKLIFKLEEQVQKKEKRVDHKKCYNKHDRSTYLTGVRPVFFCVFSFLRVKIKTRKKNSGVAFPVRPRWRERGAILDGRVRWRPMHRICWLRDPTVAATALQPGIYTLKRQHHASPPCANRIGRTTWQDLSSSTIFDADQADQSQHISAGLQWLTIKIASRNYMEMQQWRRWEVTSI